MSLPRARTNRKINPENLPPVKEGMTRKAITVSPSNSSADSTAYVTMPRAPWEKDDDGHVSQPSR